MSQRYFLPCECGQSLVVQIGQAGQSVACACGRTVTVPGMRDIRRLQPTGSNSAEKSDHRAPAAAGFSATRAVFALAVAVAFLGLAFAGFMMFQRSQLELGLLAVERRTLEDSIIETLKADEAFDAWRELRGFGLGSQTPTPDLINQRLYKDAGQAIQQALIVTAIAGALAAMAAFVDRKKSK